MLTAFIIQSGFIVRTMNEQFDKYVKRKCRLTIGPLPYFPGLARPPVSGLVGNAKMDLNFVNAISYFCCEATLECRLKGCVSCGGACEYCSQSCRSCCYSRTILYIAPQSIENVVRPT